MRAALLVVHVVSGTAGLGLGAVAMYLPKRPGWHPGVTGAYLVAVIGVCGTAIGLTVLRPSLWWLSLIAVATATGAAGGFVAARRRSPGWAGRSVRLLGMSYVSLVTALVVVSVPVPVVWVLPTAIGEPLIHRAARAARSRPTPNALAIQIGSGGGCPTR